jgi:hypothetical protein
MPGLLERLEGVDVESSSAGRPASTAPPGSPGVPASCCTDAGFGTDGTALYTAGDLGSETGANDIGDSAAGLQAGDRTLAASTSEVLCSQALLPASTGNVRSLKTGATLTVNAEQITDNP